MDHIYTHLRSHQDWHKLLAIKNQTVVARQDDERVGLLQEKGIRDVAEVKDDVDLAYFTDTNVAVNILTTTAQKIDTEFQTHIRLVMERFGEFRAGPTKSVERCQSKVENEYQEAVYPRAARLLDYVRCSVSFNTLEQLLTGYEGLMRYVQDGSDSLELARVKNCFLAQTSGYRDIKVNVVYHAETDPENPVSMICEVQLVLNQYLHEKKRSHKLYSILREQAFFDMVVKEDHAELQKTTSIKNLQFEPILNVSQDVQFNSELDGALSIKCSVEPTLGLLAMNTAAFTATSAHSGGWCDECEKRFFCIDMATKKVIFDHQIENYHSHHWVRMNDEQYVSLQTSKNIIEMFQFNSENKQFERDVSKTIRFQENEEVNFYEFDINFQNMFVVKNKNILEKRSCFEGSAGLLNVELVGDIGESASKMLSVADDGSFCVIGGGAGKSYFYLVDIENAVQYKLNSKALTDTLAPCFINGDTVYLVVGGDFGQGAEMWNVSSRTPVRTFAVQKGDYITCTASANNILAIGYRDSGRMLYDVTNWELFHSAKYRMSARSVHLTSDSRYLTVGGDSPRYGRAGNWRIVVAEKCVVLKI